MPAVVLQKVRWPVLRRRPMYIRPGDGIRVFRIEDGRIGNCRQRGDGAPIDRPDCANQLNTLPAVRDAMKREPLIAIIGRTRVVVADSVRNLPPPFSPARNDRLMLQESRLRAIVEPDGRLTNCSTERSRRPEELTMCDMGIVISVPRPGTSTGRRYLAIDDRLTAIPARKVRRS